MLQPKPKFTPPSDAVVVESESSFVPPSDAIEIKKKEPTESTFTTPAKNLESVQRVGSSDGVGSNGFPSIDVNLGVPGLKPNLKTVEQLANRKDSVREDGTLKGNGYLGKLKMRDGSNQFATEKSIGVEIDGKEELIPSIVPTLDKNEIDFILKGGDILDKKNPISNKIIQKAVDFAYERKSKNLPFFANNANQNPPKSKSTIQAEQNNALKYEKFKQFSTLPDEIKKENAQKVEDEVNGVGFLNNVTSFGKEAYNSAIEGLSRLSFKMGANTSGLKELKVNTEPLADEKKEAKDLMLKQGVNPKDINSNSVLELAKKIKLQKLNDSDVESRKKDFLSDTDIDFEDLKKGASLELSKISNKDKELLKQKAVLEPALRDSDNRLNQLNQQLANFKKNGQQPTPEFVDEYNYAIKYHNDIVKDVQKTDNQFAENRDKIGDLKTNLDLFKRQYGKVNNFVSNIGATALDLAAGGFGIVDYGFNAAYGALGVDTGPKESSEIVTGLKSASKSIRDRIAKPINIDNIEDAGDFGDWMANTVIANQIPIYGLIATGTGGIVALGGSSLGTKYGDMVQEMNPENPIEGQILKNYSNAELAWKPVGFGIAETASALVDAHIMKGAARVLASATQPERRLISQTVARKLLDVGSKTVEGGVTEAADEMATQGVENLIDGKPFTEGMKDAGGAGGAMGALIPFFAGNIAIAAKPFSIDNKIQNSAKRTLALEKELANPSLSEDAKKIIQTNFEESKKTTENLLKKQVRDISKMSNENFQEILRIENEQAKLKAKAIEIKTQEGLSKDIKKQLLSDFSTRFNEIEVDRIDVLSGKKTMPKIEEDAKVEIPIAETEVETEVQEPTNEQKVAQLRVDEQNELKETLPNAELNAEGKIDEEKLSTEDQAEFNKIYDKYDELITPLLRAEAEPTSPKSGDVVADSVEGEDSVKDYISNLSNDNYLFTHVTTENNARNITENGMSVSLGTGISSTLTASGQDSAINQAERLMNGEVVHRDLNNNSVAIISVPKAELDKMTGKSLAEKFENWLVENNHINSKGELAIPKEFNAGYLSGKSFITNKTAKQSKSEANKTELVEKATETTKDSIPNKFEKSLTLLKEINSKQGVDARNAKRERNEFLKENPTIKYIDDNYKNIIKQLEKQGLFKQLKDC